MLPHFDFYIKPPKSISKETLLDYKCGLATEGKMYQRIVFPIFNKDAKIHGFSGRKVLDKNGNPIYDKNSSGGVDLADIVTPILTTTSGAITGGTTAGATTGTSAGGQGTVNVVTTADNSQRNSQSINTYYTNLLSASRNPISDASVNAGMPG